jgi:hypothetical protein
MKEVNLHNIAGGVANELFERELKSVAKNVTDQNTPAKRARTITLTFTFMPDEERNELRCTVQAKANLAPVKPFVKSVYTGKHATTGAMTMYGEDQRQTNLFDETNVRKIDGKSAAAGEGVQQ